MTTTYYHKDLIDKNIIPDDCYIFICWECKLDKLPKLPDILQKLYCSRNILTELPVLPNGLLELYCQVNKITELPVLPNGLIELHCYHNPIKYITPDMYSIMRRIYLTDETSIDIGDTIFYENSECSSEAEFFGF